MLSLRTSLMVGLGLSGLGLFALPHFPISPPPDLPVVEDRTAMVGALKDKIAQGKPLIVHVFVPLCDNAHQGIVKVNASLGNGQNPKTNLYWGAGYGVKTHFKRSAEWKTVLDGPPGTPNLLDRVVFSRKMANGAIVYLIADAYDGSAMGACIADFYGSLAGQKTGKIDVAGQSIGAWCEADLLVLNGHNGLMDVDVELPRVTENKAQDAMVIACASQGYFLEPLRSLGDYPLITTTGLLAPEAYVLKAAVESWAELKDGAAVRVAAGTAYNQYQKCGIKGATNLFKTGW